MPFLVVRAVLERRNLRAITPRECSPLLVPCLDKQEGGLEKIDRYVQISSVLSAGNSRDTVRLTGEESGAGCAAS